MIWTGCQWKAIHRDWFGVCSSVLHDRFQEWQRSGVFLKLLLRWYASMHGGAAFSGGFKLLIASIVLWR